MMLTCIEQSVWPCIGVKRAMFGHAQKPAGRALWTQTLSGPRTLDPKPSPLGFGAGSGRVSGSSGDTLICPGKEGFCSWRWSGSRLPCWVFEVEVSSYQAGVGWGGLCHKGVQATALIHCIARGIVDIDQECSLLGSGDSDSQKF